MIYNHYMLLELARQRQAHVAVGVARSRRQPANHRDTGMGALALTTLRRRLRSRLAAT